MGQRPSLQSVSMRQCNLPQVAMPQLAACIPAWPLLRRLDLAGLYVPARAFRAMVTALIACPDFALPAFHRCNVARYYPNAGAGVLRWRRVEFSEGTPTAVQVVQFLRRLLEHNQQAFVVTCGYCADALQDAYTGLLNELGLLPPPCASCVVAFGVEW